VTSGVIERLHREIGAGGFTAYDGTVAFYARIDALLSPEMTVLDYGAGRGAWMHDEDCSYRRKIRNLRGRVKKIIGCDVDPIVHTNPSLEETILMQQDEQLQLPDESIDLIIADYVVEHIESPERFANEIYRLLSPGGWFCARTPSKYHYVSMISSILPSRLGKYAVAKAQPNRKKEDMFSAFYRINTSSAVSRCFPPLKFDNYSYYFSFEPQYHFNNEVIYRCFQFLHWLLPPAMKANLFVFVRKRRDNRN
jgi:SAM-dependent methyltransferase